MIDYYHMEVSRQRYQEIVRLIKLLNRYGGHDNQCERPLGPECTCGWEKLKEEIKEGD